MDYYQDEGIARNEPIVPVTMTHLANVYDDSSWKVTGYGVKTDTHGNAWCRAPGK